VAFIFLGVAAVFAFAFKVPTGRLNDRAGTVSKSRFTMQTTTLRLPGTQ